MEYPTHAPLWAGFESAKLHWNSQDILVQTDHIEGRGMAQHYRDALSVGVQGFRDALPGRCRAPYRIQQARSETGPDVPIVWDIIHFDDWKNPLSHVRDVVRYLHPADRLIAVNEPSVGKAVSGRTIAEAVAVSAGIMTTALMYRPETRFWTCDPIHHPTEEAFQATDALMSLFSDQIEVVGINYYPIHSRHSLSDILRTTAQRYNKPIAITETGWHIGHPDNWAEIEGQREWWNHVQSEIEASGADVRACCWFPWLANNWDGGEPWPHSPQFFWEGSD